MKLWYPDLVLAMLVVVRGWGGRTGTGTSDDTGSLVSRAEFAESVNVSVIAAGELKQQCSRGFPVPGPAMIFLPQAGRKSLFPPSFPPFVPHSFLAISN